MMCLDEWVSGWLYSKDKAVMTAAVIAAWVNDERGHPSGVTA